MRTCRARFEQRINLYCFCFSPYKGALQYYSIPLVEAKSEYAVWAYEKTL